MGVVMFVIGVAVVERRRRRLCIPKCVFARDDWKRVGILNDVEACAKGCNERP